MDSKSIASRVVEAWRKRDQTAGILPPKVVTYTRGAALIIEVATSCNLPLPSDVLVSAAAVELTFDTLYELYKWAEWLGEPIANEILHLGPFGSMTHHAIQTDLYDVAVRFSTASTHAVSR